jgi:hypothetical protein
VFVDYHTDGGNQLLTGTDYYKQNHQNFSKEFIGRLKACDAIGHSDDIIIYPNIRSRSRG